MKLKKKVKELEEQNKKIAIDLRDSLKKEIKERVETLEETIELIKHGSSSEGGRS